jgi:hypothetical protein
MKRKFAAYAAGTAGAALLLVLCSCLRAAAATDSATALRVEPGRDTSSWTILNGEKKVMIYAFAPQKFKPYVKELCTIRGDNILRDAPHDHLHHHALMYAIKVNGINFWEELSGHGVQKVIESPEPVTGVTGLGGERRPQATIQQLIHWVAPQDAFLPSNAPVALLIEKRTLVLTLNPRTEEVALEWKSQFEVGPRTNSVTLTGANYHGLGMRFLQELDPLAIHSLAGVRPDLSNNRQEVAPAAWAAVSFDRPTGPATIALSGHPSNARGDATYFNMLTPFAYLAATQALDKEPLVYRQGEKFELSYLILVYPEAKPSEKLRDRMERWRENKR